MTSYKSFYSNIMNLTSKASSMFQYLGMYYAPWMMSTGMMETLYVYNNTVSSANSDIDKLFYFDSKGNLNYIS